MQIKKAKSLQGRLDFQASKQPQDDVRFCSKRMTFNEAKQEYEAGKGHTRAEHIAAYSPATNPLAIPEGWTVHEGHVLDWLFCKGALLTRLGIFNVNAQIYHTLEYLTSFVRRGLRGLEAHHFKNNLLQQLEAGRDGRHYAKVRARKPELCLGWKCWKVTFTAFKDLQPFQHSGEETFFDLIGKDRVRIKEAITQGTESAYFRMIAPDDAERVHLIGSKRVIKEDYFGDHAISNRHMGLMRLCSSGEPSATDYRFLRQEGHITMGGVKHYQFNDEVELKGASLPTLRAFFADAHEMVIQSGYYLPEIDVDFDFVTAH
jgi:hypothetical protein